MVFQHSLVQTRPMMCMSYMLTVSMWVVVGLEGMLAIRKMVANTFKMSSYHNVMAPVV